MSTQFVSPKFFFAILIALLVCWCSFSVNTIRAQAKKPYSKVMLLEALRKNAQTRELSAADFVSYIEQRGVDFELNSADDARFRAAGAAPEVIAAIRNNYRPVLPPGTATLTITTSVGDCSVLLDGQSRGVTNSSGVLTLRPIKAGPHKLLVKKDGYEQQERAIVLVPGNELTVSFTVSQPKGNLTVVTNIDGAEVYLDAVQYAQGITNLALAPGTYQLRVSRKSFKPFTRDVAIKPGQPVTVEAPLEPIPVNELLDQVSVLVRQDRYNEAISIDGDILAAHPDNGRANLLMGLAYYKANNYSGSAAYLTKAIALGEQVALPIKHHHAGLNDGLCTGTLVIGKGVLAFNSIDRPKDSFSVPTDHIYELSPEPGKNGRVHVRFGIQNGSKEDKKTYNFQMSRAYLAHFNADPNSILVVRCDGCGDEVSLIYQLIKALRDNPKAAAAQ